MLKNYIKIGLRNLWRYRSYTFINSLGMALSMSVSILLIMLLADQKSVDGYNPNKENIYRINTLRLNSDDLVNRFATAPLPLAQRLKDDYPGVDQVVRIRDGFGNDWIGIDNSVNVPVGGFFVDPEFLDLFHYKLKSGNPEVALKEPNSVVLTEEAAERLFDNRDPLGELIKVGELGEYMITGIIEDHNEKSHIKFDALASLSSLIRIEKDSLMGPVLGNWKNSTSGFVYFSLKEGIRLHDLTQYLADVNEEIYGENEDIEWQFLIQGLGKITPGPLLSNEIGPTLPMLFVYFLGGLALIIVISSAFNYTNLSVARALTRAREVGIRKVSGARKHQLIGQFLTESILISLLSLAGSYLILFILKPAFLELNFSRLLHWDLSDNIQVHIIALIFAVLVGILSGIFPAFILSSFQPIKVMKDLSGIRLFSRMGLRKFLIVTQFSLSLIFIISVSLVYNQFRMMINYDFGFTTENILDVGINDEVSYTQFKTRLNSETSIKGITGGSHIPGIGMSRQQPVFKDLDGQEPITMNYFGVDENYMEIMGLTLIAGKNFDPSVHEPGREIIINEVAVSTLGFNNPYQAIDGIVFSEDSSQVRIIGVMENFHYVAVMAEIGPLYLSYNPNKIQIAHISYLSDKDEAIRSIEKAYSDVSGGYKADIKSLEDEIRFFYDLTFGDLMRIVFLITVLSIVISCMGLLGIATYSIETRLKEVSIRKVMGATGKDLILQLSKGFVIMLLIAIFISVPMSWLINNLWLQQIAYRVDISAGVILTGVGILVFFGLATILSQTWKAGSVAPVEHLRNE